MYFLIMLFLAVIDPTAVTVGILIALSTLVFVLSIFYVNAKYIFFVISIALTRFILNNILLVDIEPDKFIVLMVEAFKWLDILLAILLSLSLMIGIFIGRPLSGESLYQLAVKIKVERKALKLMKKHIGK
ncbi:hypothetical protein N5J41_16550 [Acinetobacter ursingii]|uniref:hypothetical protein n=2 Tax=Acinetobacter ursingii TaxID=108980 RepID=UPI00244CC231|nr:hypothetical protein [Acinetobacter ursingii]MDH2020739.1 hypothetical protein [Acinetobacter ursingii]